MYFVLLFMYVCTSRAVARRLWRLGAAEDLCRRGNEAATPWVDWRATGRREFAPERRELNDGEVVRIGATRESGASENCQVIFFLY